MHALAAAFGESCAIPLVPSATSAENPPMHRRLHPAAACAYSYCLRRFCTLQPGLPWAYPFTKNAADAAFLMGARVCCAAGMRQVAISPPPGFLPSQSASGGPRVRRRGRCLLPLARGGGCRPSRGCRSASRLSAPARSWRQRRQSGSLRWLLQAGCCGQGWQIPAVGCRLHRGFCSAVSASRIRPFCPALRRPSGSGFHPVSRVCPAG